MAYALIKVSPGRLPLEAFVLVQGDPGENQERTKETVSSGLGWFLQVEDLKNTAEGKGMSFFFHQPSDAVCWSK